MIIILSATSNNNLQLANSVAEVIAGTGMDTLIVNLEDLGLPLYTPKEEEKGVPNEIQKLRADLIASKGSVWLAPEYNGSVPPVINNTIAWLSRSGGDDWREVFNYRFAVVGTHSGGGGVHVCQNMRGQLEFLGTTVLARSIITNYKKPFNPDSARVILEQLISLTR